MRSRIASSASKTNWVGEPLFVNAALQLFPLLVYTSTYLLFGSGDYRLIPSNIATGGREPYLRELTHRFPQDWNVVFPLDRLRSRPQGIVGSVASFLL
jgi:hypothetical protein